MKDDPIVAEIRMIREEMLASYAGDYMRMFRDMMKRQWESGHKVVVLPGKRSDAKDKAEPRVAEPKTEYAAKAEKNRGPLALAGRKTPARMKSSGRA